MKTTVRALTVLLSLIIAVPLLAQTSPPATNRLPVVLPDGKPYADPDFSARGLPEAPYPGTRMPIQLPQLSPVRRLSYEGWWAAVTNRPSAARLNFARALRITPNDRRLLWSYGWAQLNMGEPAMAMAAFQRNLALRPNNRPRWLPMAMALTYTAAGEREAAVAWYRSAALSDPLQWGSDNQVLRTTLEWTPQERALVSQLLEYAAQGDRAEPASFARLAER